MRPATTNSTDNDAQVQRLVDEHLDLARRLASRYAGRGEPLDDLHQVARLGLILAARRFDPDRGTGFVAYATPTILGELRRHFRDHCWTVQVPRPVHDLYRETLGAWEQMTATLHREPTLRELADELEVSGTQLAEALNGGGAYSTMSLDRAGVDDGETGHRTLEEVIGEDDSRFVTIEQREATRRLMPQVPDRERRMLTLWFYDNRTQTQIAEEFGISQMQVSRLIDGTLTRLRTAIEQDVAEPISWPKTRRRAAAA